jgi:DNA polymerase-3 subunit beta
MRNILLLAFCFVNSKMSHFSYIALLNEQPSRLNILSHGKDDQHMTMTASPTSTRSTEPLDMALTCKQEDLARGIALVRPAVLATSTWPILKNILVGTDGGYLRLSATTLEIAIQVWIKAQVTKEGITAIPADLLTKMVGTLAKGEAVLAVPAGSQTLRIQCEGSLTRIRGFDPREFPFIPGIDEQQSAVTVKSKQLKEMIEQVAFAAEDSNTKPILTAINLEVVEETITLAATTGLQLGQRVAHLAERNAANINVNVPARSMEELARVLPGEGNVQIMATPQHNQIIFHIEPEGVEPGERIDVVSCLINGDYPNYRNFIPKQFTTRATMETKVLAAAVKAAAVFAQDSTASIRVTFNPSNGGLFGTLLVEGDDPDLGSHASTVVAEVTGPEQKLLFNAAFFLEALTKFDTPQVVLSVIGPGRQAVLKPTNGMEYVSLMMTPTTQK